MILGTDCPVEKYVSNIIFLNGPTEKVQKSLEILLTITKNILTYPTEEKYRKLKASNAKLKNDLFCFEGVEEFVLFLGFENIEEQGKDGAEFVLLSEKTEVLEKASRILQNKLNNWVKGKISYGDTIVEKEVVRKRTEHFEKEEYKKELIRQFEQNKKEVLEEKKQQLVNSSKKNNFN